MKINIETIPHKEQRYDTCGDWFLGEDGSWQIRVSKLSDWRYEFLIGFHELFEMAWCIGKGVAEEEVTAFDKAFEERRKTDPSIGDSEPGDDPKAPYYIGHHWATVCERLAAGLLGVKWDEYETEILDLEY